MVAKTTSTVVNIFILFLVPFCCWFCFFVLFLCSTMSLSANCLELVLDQVVSKCGIDLVLPTWSSCNGPQGGLHALDTHPPSQRTGLTIREPHLVVPVPSLPCPHPRGELCLYPRKPRPAQVHVYWLMALLSALLHTPVITLSPSPPRHLSPCLRILVGDGQCSAPPRRLLHFLPLIQTPLGNLFSLRPLVTLSSSVRP